MKLKILCTICLIETIVILILGAVCFGEDDSPQTRNIIDSVSPCKKYRIIIDEVGQAWPLGSLDVEVYIAQKVESDWAGRTIMKFSIANEGAVSKENIILEWLGEGVILHIKARDQADCVYRIYWTDFFATGNLLPGDIER